MDGAVLVTGASGALGGLVARHLAATGRAARLVLVSRRGPEARGAARLAAELAGLGAAVDLAACDVADRGALAGMVARSSAAGTSAAGLRGVVHAAGVLDDGVIGSLSAVRLDAVLHPRRTVPGTCTS